MATYKVTPSSASFYASSSGVSTYATTSGISTVAQGLTGTPNVTIGTLTASSLNLSGIATVGLGTTSTPQSNSQLSFELTSNTNLRIKVRGTDGVLRSANITLA